VFNLGVKKGPIANKFKQFKWPLYMFFALIAFPIIMIISDSLLSPLLMAFTSTAPIKLMSIDVSNLNSYCLGNSDNCDFQLLATIGSKVQVGGSFLQNYLDTYVTNLNKAIDKMQAEMAKGDDAKQEFGILATYLGDLKVSITKVQSYVDKDLAALQGKINNFFTSLGMIPSQGIFMTKEESDTIHGFINSLNDFSSSFYDLSTLSDKMGSSYCDVG
jgi:predicted PurR-regulated permease PerM